MRKTYAERHQVLCDAADQKLTGFLEIVPTDTGLHTIGRLPPEQSETAIAAAALKRDIVVTPIERFCIAPTGNKGLVLGFSGIKPREIIDGVQVLAEVLEKLAP